MGLETDEQIIARKARERAVAIAWKQFKHASRRRVRRKINRLPLTGVYRNDH